MIDDPIRALRLSGLTQQALAERAGVSLATISRMVRKDAWPHTPSVRTAVIEALQSAIDKRGAK